jgi:prepilin-type N-terminal cleavage/methylation domain-containing protein
MTRPSHSSRRGFTLIETIAAMVVVAVIGSLASGILYTAIGSYRDATTRAQIHNNCSAAFDRLTKLLWSIPRDTSASVVAPLISNVTATSITWDTDWTLSLSGTQLMLTENGGTARAVLDNVTAFTVSCFDQSNAALAASLSGSATQAIRRIQIQVTVTRQGISESLRTRAYIRSLMTGAKIG